MRDDQHVTGRLALGRRHFGSVLHSWVRSIEAGSHYPWDRLVRDTVLYNPSQLPIALDLEPVVVSILIVNFRAYAELTACLNSLQSSLSNDLEVIVVDHATDSSAANELRDLFPWIHLIADRANPGFAAGVNRASRDAKGRYLFLLNPDCVVCEGVPEMLAAWLDAQPI